MSNVTKDFDIWTKDISASTVLRSLPDAVFITDSQMRIFYFNLAAEKLTGFKSREALGMYCKDILKSGICETECIVKRALDADKNIFNIETTIVTAIGRTIPILSSALLIKDAKSKIFGYLYSFRDISVLKKVMSDLEISRAELTERNIELARTLEELARDITERKRMEEALRDSERRYRLLFNGITDAVYVHEVSVENPGKFFAVNDSACRMLGYTRDEFLQMEVKDIDIDEQAEKLPSVHEKLFRDGYALFEGCHVAKDGRRIPVEINIQLFELQGKSMVLAVARDITERKQAAEALQRAEQLQVAGELATGLAHELRNSLTGINISIEVLLDELVFSEDDRRVLMNMLNETRRIEFLMKDLLNFARPSNPQLASVNIHAVLDTALKLSLKNVSTLADHGRSIDVVKEFDYHIPRTMADQMQLQQIFMNLLLNAVEAMQNGGSLKVQTSYDVSNDLIHISISDTGKGIDHKLIDKIFEPFFTTKPKGTGLGLSITKRLIEQHGGNIRVETSLGKGTTFNIVLPVKQFEEFKIT